MQMVRMPMACLALVGYAYSYYRKKKRLRIQATYYFDAMVYATLVHLLADAVTEYTVNHREQVSETFNYVWHIVFLFSVITVCMLMYYYLLSYVERGIGRRKTWERRITLLIWILDMAAILLLPIEYIDTPHGSYSLGPKAYALYVGVVYVMVLMLYNLFRYWKLINKERRKVMLSSVIIFVTVSLAQMVFPWVLLTGAAVALITTGILNSVEDSNQYLDARTGFYNERACQVLLEELLCQKDAFPILFYTVFGSADQTREAIQSAGEYMRKCHAVCVILQDNLIVALPAPFDFWGRCQLPDAMPAFLEPGALSKEYSKTFLCRPEQKGQDILDSLYQYKDRLEETELYRDELTGLLRRRAFIQRAAAFLDQDNPFSMLILDVDNFKTINDTYGHMAGDDILRGAAKAFQDTLRDRDVICRLGGDEFAILLSNVSEESMLEEILGRLARATGDVPSAIGLHFQLQLSIGVKIRHAGEDYSFEDLYEAADTALYRAKKKGRNCYVILKDEENSSPEAVSANQ